MNYLELHRDEIFKKYTTEELLKDIENYKSGSGRLSKVLNHFFEECIFNSKSNRYNFTPFEVLENKEMMNYILEYIKTKPNFYTGSEISNVKSFFRNGTRYARKVANFCPKTARDIYFRYNDINGDKLNILDTSMGFGSRMSSVLLNGHNYCGFDPNKELYEKLKEYYSFLKENNIVTNEQKCGMYCQGSEVYRPELSNMFDVSFTSPPYFNLESYSCDNGTSTKYHDNYNLWIEYFAKPTINNTYNYLKIDGYAMINIKNLTNGKRETLFDDFINIFMENSGFEFIEVFDIEHQGKKNFTMNCNYSKEQYIGFKEPIMVFRKVK